MASKNLLAVLTPLSNEPPTIMPQHYAGADPDGSIHQAAKDAQIEWLAEQLLGPRR